jgi:hypothetical protein
MDPWGEGEGGIAAWGALCVLTLEVQPGDAKGSAASDGS